jgi:hypothetical protein
VGPILWYNPCQLFLAHFSEIKSYTDRGFVRG